MATRRSLHIGLNAVDADSYGGWTGKLQACEADAYSMQDVASARNFEAEVIRTKDATIKNVYAEIEKATMDLKSGDYYFLTYSGHGGQVPDKTGEESDKLDETWMLYDRQLVDDQIYGILSKFAVGVRVLVLSDSCHSGSVTRGHAEKRDAEFGTRPGSKRAPLATTEAEYKAHKADYDKRADEWPSMPNPKVEFTTGAGVILLSGCRDDQESMDGTNNGAFTAAFLDVWDNGRFKGNHNTLLAGVRKKLAEQQYEQRPDIFSYGNDFSGLVLSQPLAD
ncbi:caspase family protein [Nocardia sp. A7]|uniref:caspase family protein n=1 Tax=Nocardia sp. A7 TaxID=2789274 RepID=UPI00397BA251